MNQQFFKEVNNLNIRHDARKIFCVQNAGSSVKNQVMAIENKKYKYTTCHCFNSGSHNGLECQYLTNMLRCLNFIMTNILLSL